MAIAHHTGAADLRFCDCCGTMFPHHEIRTVVCDVEKAWWSPGSHAAPCGLPCISGGVKPAQIRGDGVHGYQDRCPRCGPLRVLPEVVDEMRGKALADIVLTERCSSGPWRVLHGGTEWSVVRDTDGAEEIARVHIRVNQCDYDGELSDEGLPDENAQLMARSREIVPRSAGDLLRALAEIAKLTAERDEARRALDAALEQNRALQMRLDDAEIAAHEAKGFPPILHLYCAKGGGGRTWCGSTGQMAHHYDGSTCEACLNAFDRAARAALEKNK